MYTYITIRHEPKLKMFSFVVHAFQHIFYGKCKRKKGAKYKKIWSLLTITYKLKKSPKLKMNLFLCTIYFVVHSALFVIYKCGQFWPKTWMSCSLEDVHHTNRIRGFLITCSWFAAIAIDIHELKLF